MKRLSSGAEAIIFLDKDKIIKKRVEKKYRHERIDSQLRKARTRREAKVLEKIPVSSPKLIESDGQEIIVMNYLKGPKVRDVLDKKPLLAKEIGEKLARIHDSGIIHGDLTTSNMILKDKDIHFIDFGLSFFSAKEEDKAVDIHLFKQALESKHYKVFEKAYEYFIQGYKKSKKFKQTMERLKNVEKRGRYKKK